MYERALPTALVRYLPENGPQLTCIQEEDVLCAPIQAMSKCRDCCLQSKCGRCASRDPVVFPSSACTPVPDTMRVNPAVWQSFALNRAA